MGDNIPRQRLEKKFLDRWENEGGRLYAGPKATSPTSTRAKIARHRPSDTLTARATIEEDANRSLKIGFADHSFLEEI